MAINNRINKLEKTIETLRPRRKTMLLAYQDKNGHYSHEGKKYKTLEELSKKHNVKQKEILVIKFI